MAFKYLTGASLTLALLVTTACTANINATTPGTTAGGGGGETAKAAVQASVTAPEAQQLSLSDLMPYRIETTNASEANKTWIIYYYSPKANKSYRCTQRVGQKVDFVEVTDASLVYTTGDDIDQTKWKVDSEQAKTACVQAFQQVNTTVSITTINVTNMVLLSAKEYTRRTGKPSDDPVWMCTVQPPATTASPSPSMAPSASPTAVPTTTPSASPTVAPTASPTVVNNITNVYINANTGNQIAVNTGTQTNTTTTQTDTGNTTATSGSATTTTTTP